MATRLRKTRNGKCSVRITKFVPNVDMRKVHDWRKKYRRGLQAGEGVLLMNSRWTQFRVITSAGGQFQDWAPDGQVFDVDAIQQQIGALNLRLEIPAATVEQLNEWDEAA